MDFFATHEPKAASGSCPVCVLNQNQLSFLISQTQVSLWMLLCLLVLSEAGLPSAARRADPSPALVEQWPDHVTESEKQTVEPNAHISWGGLFVNPTQSEPDDRHGRWQRSPSKTGSRRSSRKNRRKPKGDKHCRMERKEMRVRDLGLGFDSDEIILFKYCAGTCRSSRMNYDLALKKLVDNGTIPKQESKKVSLHPCCRPTSYEPVVFMDAQTTWRTIEYLSAANCSCVR
ncbi:artemin isoform X2 [Brienomyrus brachyistius]|uniref:artemin isoform X2 n=1 Tax=Brienomyrus brachyistius TaxID=42636 RepID=UPI0020B1957C|nr:artemin isoform X2 [Brienomyrus brachyistius]